MLFVCSAGNLDLGEDPYVPPRWPARHPNALSVGSYNSDGYRAYGSVRGTLWAPGEDICAVDMIESPGNRFIWGYEANPQTYADHLWGTSFAAPHVSAVAGMLSHYRRFDYPWQLRGRIMERSDLLVNEFGVLGYKLNAYNTLRP